MQHNITLLQQYSNYKLLNIVEPVTHLEKELSRRLDEYMKEYDETAQEMEMRIEKTYERPLEQLYFAQELLSKIKELCEKPTAQRKKLIETILHEIENSLFEL